MLAAHFQNFDAAVASPISKGRAGYWLGRAHAALGDADAAHKAYDMGAQFQTSFYGLLAAERIGRRFAECIRRANAFRGSMHSEAVCIRRQYASRPPNASSQA